jgi:predicted GH43/DUF377 family glycosyl hydrolase
MKFRLDYLLFRILLGRRWRGKLWPTKSDLERLETLIKVRNAPRLVDQYGLQSFEFKWDAGEGLFNPSIVEFGTNFLVSARQSNLINKNDGDCRIEDLEGRVISECVLAEYSRDFQKIREFSLNFGPIPKEEKRQFCGIEDIRLFDWDGKIWLIGAAVFRDSRSRKNIVKQCLARLDGETLSELQNFDSPLKRDIEKNWIPLVRNSELFFVYRFQPLGMLELQSAGQLVTIKPLAEGTDFDIRGGTPFIRWHGVWLTLVHSNRMDHAGKVYYTHNLLVLDDEFDIFEISEPFFIERSGIEFATGLIASDGGVYVTYGVADRVSKGIFLPHKLLADQLRLTFKNS